MRSLIVLFALVGTCIIGCGKEESIDSTDPDNKPAAVSGQLQANINGTQWVANSVAGASRMAGLISIVGRSSDRKTFTITLADSGVHKYTITDEPFNAAVWIDSTEATPTPYTTNQTDDAARSGGEVTITAIDEAKKTISGTFSVKVFRYDTEKTTISEGSFTNLAYVTTPAATSPGKDTFRVKINGASWAPATFMGVKAPNMNIIGISSFDQQGLKSVGVHFPSNITPGTYALGGMFDEHVGQYKPDADPSHLAFSVSGTLTILEHNTSTKRIRGNFSFKAAEALTPANTTDITDGYFSVQYF